MASIQLTPTQIRLLRLRSQRLHPETTLTKPDQLIHTIGALQSQEWTAAMLAIRARTNGLTADHVRHAREVERSVVLTWAMRGTMHLVASVDVQWMLSLFGDRFIRQAASRYRQLNLDETTRYKAADLMRTILAEQGPLTRPELANALAVHGIPVEGQAIHHLVRFAALRGVICFGPERDGVLTYVALDNWLSECSMRQLAGDQALAELARRYIGAYGPAKLEDFVRWSGLPKKMAQIGFEAVRSDLIEVDLMQSPGFMLSETAAWLDAPHVSPVVKLLPRYDSYWLGYASREGMVRNGYAKRIHPGGGLIHPSLITDGQAVANWRIKRAKDGVSFQVTPFEVLAEDVVQQVKKEAEIIAQFLGAPLRSDPVTIDLPAS